MKREELLYYMLNLAEYNTFCFSVIIFHEKFQSIKDSIFQDNNISLLALELLKAAMKINPSLIVTPKFVANLVMHINQNMHKTETILPFIEFLSSLIISNSISILFMIDGDYFPVLLDMLRKFSVLNFPNQDRSTVIDIDLIFFYLTKIILYALSYNSDKSYFREYIVGVFNKNVIMTLNKFYDYYLQNKNKLLLLEEHYQIGLTKDPTIDKQLNLILDTMLRIHADVHITNTIVYQNLLLLRSQQIFYKGQDNYNDQLRNVFMKNMENITVKYKLEFQLGEESIGVFIISIKEEFEDVMRKCQDAIKILRDFTLYIEQNGTQKAIKTNKDYLQYIDSCMHKTNLISDDVEAFFLVEDMKGRKLKR